MHDPVYLPLVAIMGWIASQLVNYLSDVLPATRSLSQPLCQTCREEIGFTRYFLFPFQQPACGHRRNRRAWLVTVIGVLVACWMWLSPPARLGFYIGFILLIYLGVVAVIDIEHKLILHPVSIAGVVICGAIGIWSRGVLITILGGAVGFLIMLIFYLFGVLFARWLSKRRGLPEDEVALGFGDVNLSGVLGLLLGWPGIVGGLILAILSAGLASLLYIIWMLVFRRYQSFAAIPYGPFLILGAIILLYL